MLADKFMMVTRFKKMVNSSSKYNLVYRLQKIFGVSNPNSFRGELFN